MKNTNKTSLSISGLCLILLTVLLASSQAHAQAGSFVVNTLAEGDDGACNAANCTLREAVKYAPAGATITFSVTGIIEMSLPAITIAKDLTITGPGASSLAVSGTGNGTGSISAASLFIITSGNVGISGLTLRDGTGTRVSTINPATGTNVFLNFGGAIYMTGGALTLTSCILSNNRGSGDGGAIYAGSGVSLTIYSTTLSGNRSQDGGAIHMNGGSSLSSLLMTDSTVSGNIADTGVGGGIFSGTNTTATVTNSTVSGNSATGQTGGGGGFFNVNGTLTIINSTISGNSTSAVTGTGPRGGGGIMNISGQLTVTNSTITGNGAVRGGGIYSDGSLNLSNSIVAGNDGGGYILSDIFGPVTAGDYNLVQNTSNTTLTGTHNITGQPALLGPLANNGGPTQTHALLPGSPAIDKGSATGTDQRGFARPVDNEAIANAANGADIGAFEVQLAPTAASVSVSGRVTTASGRGIRNVQITLIDSNGNQQTARSTTFGYYRFDDVTAGETVTLSIKARQFSFSQSTIVRTTNDSVNDADFVSEQ
jgi:CSLREA domain-containing protein